MFGKALAEHEGALGVDSVVIVKGRVDHREAGKTSVVVQSVTPFDPSDEEIEQARARADAASRAASMLSRPVHLSVSAADLTAGAIEELKQMIEDFPGPAEVLIDILTGGRNPTPAARQRVPGAAHPDAQGGAR